MKNPNQNLLLAFGAGLLAMHLYNKNKKGEPDVAGHSLSVNALEGGVAGIAGIEGLGNYATGAQSNVLPGTNVTVTATARRPFKFIGWYGADGRRVSTSANYTFPMPERNVHLTAAFEEEVIQRYDVTLDTSDTAPEPIRGLVY